MKNEKKNITLLKINKKISKSNRKKKNYRFCLPPTSLCIYIEHEMLTK